jgi:formylglycine-generating enzyme required for sulfatase activity
MTTGRTSSLKPPGSSAAKAAKRRKAVPPEMITIPAGRFIMGTNEAELMYFVQNTDWGDEWYARGMFQAEQPQHWVQLNSFEIARGPVTNVEFFHFTWETGYKVPKNWTGFYYPEEGAENPVVWVNRADALAYCGWLSQKFGMNYRLPSEAEWERAARGDDGRFYPWGDEFDPWRCNTLESARKTTSPVGLFSPSGDSPWGLNDMAGNVYEWTGSLMRPYPYNPRDGREDATSMDMSVIRGGSWYYTHKMARCAAREGVLPTFVSPALGFRVAHTP